MGLGHRNQWQTVAMAQPGGTIAPRPTARPGVTVADLVGPTGRFGLELLAGPTRLDAPVRGLVGVADLTEIDRIPAGHLAVLLGGAAAAGYELDLAIRQAATQEIAGIVLPGAWELPLTSRRLAERALLPVLGATDVVGAGAGTDLLLRLDRFLHAGAAEAMSRSAAAIDACRAAAQDTGSDDPVGDVLVAAAQALGCRVRLAEVAGPDPAAGEWAVDGVVAEMDDDATRLALPMVAALVARQRGVEDDRRFAPTLSRSELIVQIVLSERTQLPELVQQAYGLGLSLRDTHVAAWLDVAVDRATSEGARSTTVRERTVVRAAETAALQHVHELPEMWHVARLGTALLVTCTERQTSASLYGRVRRRVGDLVERLTERTGAQVVAGLGTPQSGVDGLRQSAAEARVASEVAAASGRAGEIGETDPSGLGRVLADLYASPLSRGLLIDLLAPLDAFGQEKAHTGVETLSAYLDAQGSPTRTAQALHLHPNAVTYRLRWIAAALDVDLHDPDVRFALQLACRVRLLAT